MCAPPLNFPRGGAEGMQGGGANFFQVLNFICEETLSGHGRQVIERAYGFRRYSPLGLTNVCAPPLKFGAGSTTAVTPQTSLSRDYVIPKHNRTYDCLTLPQCGRPPTENIRSSKKFQ